MTAPPALDAPTVISEARRPSAPRRLVGVAVALWALWSALIVAAAPSAPAGAIKTAFLLSMLAAPVGCIWATWHALPAQAAHRWRRAATVLIGVLACAVIVLVGHVIGVALSARLG